MWAGKYQNTAKASGWVHLDRMQIRWSWNWCTDISGTLENSVVSIEIDFKHSWLLVHSGAEPDIVIEEEITVRPSYPGQYIANGAGSYTLAVMQLEKGGFNANTLWGAPS